MKILLQKKDKTTIVTPSGKSGDKIGIEFENVEELGIALDDVVLTTARVILDLKHVDYLDSSGFGLFIDTFKALSKKNNGLFALANVNQSITRLLKIMKLDKSIQVFDSLEEAISFFILK
jgi:anti-anti-sigma factor